MELIDSIRGIYLDNPSIVYVYVALLGLFMGSFINVVAARLPLIMHREYQEEIKEYLEENGGTCDFENKKTLPKTLWGRSECPHCGHKISALENIPIISYLALRGKCKGCSSRISIKYPIVEILTSTLSILVVVYNGISVDTLLGLAFVWLMIPAVLIDFEELVLPDSMNFMLLWIAILTALVGRGVTLEEAVLGAVAGYLSLWSIYWAFKLATGKEGMGYGDFKLMSALGAILGPLSLPYIGLIAVIVSIAVMMLAKWTYKGNKAIPFGPGLAVSGFILFMVQSGMDIPILDYLLKGVV